MSQLDTIDHQLVTSDIQSSTTSLPDTINYFELIFVPGSLSCRNEDDVPTVTNMESISVSASDFAYKNYKINYWYAGSLCISGLNGLPCETLKKCIEGLPDVSKKVPQGDTLEQTMENFKMTANNIQTYLRNNILTHTATVSSINTEFGGDLVIKLQNARV